jgi:hypothetical protein
MNWTIATHIYLPLIALLDSGHIVGSRLVTGAQK